MTRLVLGVRTHDGYTKRNGFSVSTWNPNLLMHEEIETCVARIKRAMVCIKFLEGVYFIRRGLRMWADIECVGLRHFICDVV